MLDELGLEEVGSSCADQGTENLCSDIRRLYCGGGCSGGGGIGSTQYTVAANSICPKGWKLPQGRVYSDTSTTRQFGYLWQQAGITSSLTATSYATDGFNKIRTSPLFFVRGGSVVGSSLNDSGNNGYYWSSSVDVGSDAYYASLLSSFINSASRNSRLTGRSIRCMVR